MTADAQGIHVGIIMDGNGRWATARGLPRGDGHLEGARTVSQIVEAAARLGIGTLTLFAFSADNWRRPATEVRGLLALFERCLEDQLDRALANDIKVTLIGRRDRLPPSLRRGASLVEMLTAHGRRLHLRLAIDYSGREAIWQAVEHLRRSGPCSRDEFARSVRSGRGEPVDAPDVDLIIRTGGDVRLSDFLLWEAAYAELWFTEVAWPDFTPGHLADALANFATRERRFGGLPGAPAIGGAANCR